MELDISANDRRDLALIASGRQPVQNVEEVFARTLLTFIKTAEMEYEPQVGAEPEPVTSEGGAPGPLTEGGNG